MASVPPPVPPQSPIPAAPPRPVGAATGKDDPVSVLIPYKNPQALISYYVGIFALLPLIGIPLAFTSIVFGWKALKFRKLHPESHGTVHAWVGIGLSLFSFLYNIPIALGFVAAIYLGITEAYD